MQQQQKYDFYFLLGQCDSFCWKREMYCCCDFMAPKVLYHCLWGWNRKSMKLPDNTRGNVLKAKPCLSSRFLQLRSKTTGRCVSQTTLIGSSWSHLHYLPFFSFSFFCVLQVGVKICRIIHWSSVVDINRNQQSVRVWDVKKSNTHLPMVRSRQRRR